MASVPRLAVVLPGDAVAVPDTSKKIRLGPGLRNKGTVVMATKCGVVRTKGPAVWVDSSQKRAIAVVNEQVIGVITGRPGETYNVNIGTNYPATLSSLAFEGATKRNRPLLKIGDLVYGRVVVANKDMSPEITCVDTSGNASGMGPLLDGFMIECSISLCRKLLRPDCPVLTALGSHVAFELAVGMNGRIWVKANSVADTLLVVRAIEASEFLSPIMAKRLVEELVKHRKIATVQ